MIVESEEEFLVVVAAAPGERGVMTPQNTSVVSIADDDSMWVGGWVGGLEGGRKEREGRTDGRTDGRMGGPRGNTEGGREGMQ